MNLQETLAAFPPRSAYRTILPGLLDEDATVRDQAYHRLRALDRLEDGEDPSTTTWQRPESEALALLNAAIELPFPPPRVEWEDAVHDLIFPLLRSPYPTLVAPARRAYPRLSHRAKCALLALLGACGTRDAAEAFLTCIRDHGWPKSVYPRVFTELPKLVDHADVLFPDLILLAGANIGGVTDLLLYALAQGKMNLASGEVDLESLAPFAVKQLRKILKSVSKHQRTEGVAWRFAETYWEVRREAGCWLDIAGHLKAPSIEPLLGEALKLSDPRLVAFAAVALLRRGSKVSKAVLHRVAACHETHDLLFVLLENLGQLDKFPLKYRSWDAFAAAIMVTWLLYPTELGREPRVNARKYKFFDFNDLHFSERNYTYISPLVACTYEIGQIQNPKIGEYLS